MRMCNVNRAWTLDKMLANTTQTNSGCLEWNGGFFRDGYARATIKRKTKPASRVVMEFIYGPLPSEMFACHKCDNRKCINPKHLFLGSRKDNQQDAVRKGRYHGQNKTHCIHGHSLADAYVYKTGPKTGKRSCRTCRLTKTGEP